MTTGAHCSTDKTAQHDIFHSIILLLLIHTLVRMNYV